MATAEEVHEAGLAARKAILDRIATGAQGERVNSLTLLHLAEAYAYVVAPQAAHGSNVEVRSS